MNDNFSIDADLFLEILDEKEVSLFDFMDLYAEFSDLSFDVKEELLHWYYEKISKK